MPLDLSQPRIFTLQDRGRTFTMTTAPITGRQWLTYFGGVATTQELDAEGNTVTTHDSAAARLELLEAVLTDATGYTPADTSITGTDGWQGKLPMAHRRAVADLLTAVEPEPLPDNEPFELGLETVSLRATWTTGANGSMQQFAGLRHYFASPTADHQRRYSRAINTSVVLGGSRTGQTRFLGAQATLIEIYDELIESFSGYTSNGQGIPASDIANVMDAYHKVAACTALFTPVQVG